ncbi:FAD:protein FMN transferase [Litorilituus lipolyticus]|uniref:FAD:protein FMN transferase n=1 Tax=Litorilituus lipolyticus TaxID=2491017 RepID=A0A502KML3_9GAMM|nr:FAD:protein FMN transferase [Litorilituus lipolyticus]TPH12842.1 FAD:protein FMN transferase [Litorilituus lipolyticus]
MSISRKINVNLCQRDNSAFIHINFQAMASPCEIIIQSQDKQLAQRLASKVCTEVWRIEHKYSRYRTDSLCQQINTNGGLPTPIDEETFLLLNFAEQCYHLSDGLFDITTGILRKAWQFSPNHEVPEQSNIDSLLKYIGWQKVKYNQHQVTLPEKMEIDFGGIAKEYAVDKAILLAKSITDSPVLINLGGDLAVTSPLKQNKPWQVAIEHPTLTKQQPDMIIALVSGGLATSGDSKRYLIKEGKRFGHVLNAKTGWPIENAPRSITVVAPQCTQAGVLATLALLQGERAENFLNEQEVKYWVRR